MQATSAAPPRAGTAEWLTSASLIFIAVLAGITILGILWGMRLKRRRNEAERAEAARIAAAEAAAPPPAPTIAPEPPTAPPAIVAPPPPTVAPVSIDDTPARDAPAPERDLATEPALADEPIAAAAPHEASPAAEAADAPASSPPGDRPLTLLKGLGPKVATRLSELGVTNIGQLAALDSDAAEALDARLGAFTGRMARDRWIEQARFLAAGDDAGFEAVFGRL